MIQTILLPRLLQAKFNFITPTIMKHKIYLVLLGFLVICLNTVAQTYSIEVTNGKAFKVRGGSTAGIDDVSADTFGHVDVYNPQGILVKRNISREDIKYLPTGIYIVAGKKILVK